MRWFSAALLFTVAAAPHRREIWPTYSLRKLAYEADTILVASPMDPFPAGQEKTPSLVRFKVDEVLYGSQAKVSAVVELSGFGADYLFNPRGESPKEPAPEIDRALIFLRPLESNSVAVMSGFRLLTKDKSILRPEQVSSPGPYVFRPVKEASWDDILKTVKEAIEVFEKVRAIRAVRGTPDRNKALFEWIEARRKEFTPKKTQSLFSRGADSDRPIGWADLEHDIFKWIAEGGVPKDTWRAALLHNDVHGGFLPQDARDAFFATPDGRDFLLILIADDAQPLAHRVAALWYLGETSNLWPYDAPERTPPRIRLTRDEQTAMLKSLTPLLQSKETDLRRAAIRAVFGASHTGGFQDPMNSNEALPALTEAYKKESPGPIRDDLAHAVLRVGGEEHWQDLTGNPKGVLVILYGFGFDRAEAKGSFNLYMKGARHDVFERPLLVFERLGPQGETEEIKEGPLPDSDSQIRWVDGWPGSGGALRVSFDTLELSPGTWSVYVTGISGSGADAFRWSSERGQLAIPTK